MSNRPLLIIIVIVLLAIGLAKFASSIHPGGDLPPADKQAEEDRQKFEDAKKEHDARHAKVDHSPDAFDKVKEGAVHITLEVEGRGKVMLELYPKAAPKTVAQITDLIKQKFYDGIKIHRIATSPAVIQFGDPHSKEVEPEKFEAEKIGSGGSGHMIPLEVLLPHVKYSIGMARAEAVDSGDSQIYINTEANPFLDGDYCVFGRVTSGMEILPSIKLGDKIKSMVVN